MLNELLNENGVLNFIALVKDNQKNESFYLLTIGNEKMDLEDEEKFDLSSFQEMYKENDFYLIKSFNVIEKSQFFTENEEDLEKHRYDIRLLPTQLTNKKVSITKEDDIIYIESEDSNVLSINNFKLKSYEEKEDIRIIRGFIMETKKEINLKDVRSKAGNNYMLKSMNAIVSKKVNFNDIEVVNDEDIYEGDIISILYENKKETGMLLYDFINHRYILKQLRTSIPLTNSKAKNTINKIKLERTFLEAQTDTFGQVFMQYFDMDELNTIGKNISKCESISLGIGSLLSLSKSSEEVEFIMSNVIMNGLNKEDIQDYLNENAVFEDKPFTILKELPYINFLYLT